MFKMFLGFDSRENRDEYYEYFSELIDDLTDGTTISTFREKTNTEDDDHCIVLSILDSRPLIAFKNRSPKYAGLKSIRFMTDCDRKNIDLHKDIQTMVSQFNHISGFTIRQNVRADINKTGEAQYFDIITIKIDPEDQFDFDIAFVGDPSQTVTTNKFIFTANNEL